jgi:two-component system LytT family response regulator
MPPVRTLIVDDEPLAREGTRRILSADADLEFVGEAASGEDAVRVIRGSAVDLVLLDVQMPILDGFGVVEAIGADQMPVVLFLTAYHKHALRAFEARALDYVLKPFSEERLLAAVRRAKEEVFKRRLAVVSTQLSATEISARPAARASADERYATKLLIRNAGSIRFIHTRDIDWIESADYYSRIHAGTRSALIREPMQDLERRLDPTRFVRTHRSAIVNVDRIVEIQPEFRGRHIVILQDGTRLPLSRSRRADIERALGEAL